MGDAKRRRERGAVKHNISDHAEQLAELMRKGDTQAIQRWTLNLLMVEGEYRLDRVFQYVTEHHREVAIQFVRQPTRPIKLASLS